MERVRCPFCHDHIDPADYAVHEAEHIKARPDGQQSEYATLPPEAREPGTLDGVPSVYRHVKCGVATRMPEEIIRSYLKDPWLYSAGETFCCGCGAHVPERECHWVETGQDLHAYMEGLRSAGAEKAAGFTPAPGRSPALTLEPHPDVSARQLRLPDQIDQGPGEFVVTATHAKSGREYPPFIVKAADEAAARKMCRRGYLSLQSVERYAEREGAAKPRVLQFGPPVSDADFERDYGNRPADTPAGPGAAPHLLGCLGWIFLGPFGFWWGWWAGSTPEERRRDWS